MALFPTHPNPNERFLQASLDITGPFTSPQKTHEVAGAGKNSPKELKDFWWVPFSAFFINRFKGSSSRFSGQWSSDLRIASAAFSASLLAETFKVPVSAPGRASVDDGMSSTNSATAQTKDVGTPSD